MKKFSRYVNLDPKKAEHRSCGDGSNALKAERLGRAVKLKAKVTDENTGGPKKGVRVVFEMKPDPEGGANVVPRGGKAPKVKKKSALTDSNGEAKVEFTVSKYSGDVFVIGAYLPKKDEEPTVLFERKYTVRQRVYYQLSRYDKGTVGGSDYPEIPSVDMAAIVDEFEKDRRNIHLVNDSRQEKIPRGPEIISQGLDYPRLAKIGYDKSREPVSLRILLVNQIAATATKEITTSLFAHKDEEILLTEKLYKAPAGAFPVNEDWCVEAQWIAMKRPDGAEITEKELESLYFTMSDYEEDGAWNDLDRSLFTAKESSFKLAKNSLPPRFAKLRLTYRHTASETNGVSLKNAVFVAYRGASAGEEKERSATLVHEIGHFIGMVPKGQSSYYTKHGHRGPHCSTGLSQPQLALPSYAGKGGTCVMFGENSHYREDTFCDACKPSIRLSFVKIPGMPASWLT